MMMEIVLTIITAKYKQYTKKEIPNQPIEYFLLRQTIYSILFIFVVCFFAGPTIDGSVGLVEKENY